MVAERIIEETRPQILKDLENENQTKRRIEYNFLFITAKLMSEGESFGDASKSPVTKTLKEWRKYWLEATFARAGISMGYLENLRTIDFLSPQQD